MTEPASQVTHPAQDGRRDDGLLRRAAHAHRNASLRFAGGSTLDEAQQYTMECLAEALGASRVFFATWSDMCFVGRSIAGTPEPQRAAFRRRPLPTFPAAATHATEVLQISTLSDLESNSPWLADIAGADEIVLAVAKWAGRHPTCVIGIVGVDGLDSDVRVVLESFLLLAMGATIAEMLQGQRNRAELRRGEALDTLVDELDDERRRISHEIHDGVLQSVSSIAHFLETLAASAESESTRDVLERLRIEAQNSAITLRRIVNDFEPEQRAEEPMSSQITSLTHRFMNFFDLRIAVDIDPATDDLPPNRAAMRVLRQALDNVVTHAEATSVVVTTAIDGDGHLTVTVDDDGIGIENPRPWDLGVGLRSMTTVVEEHGGHLSVGPAPTGGTRLSATFPADGAGARLEPGTASTAASRGDDEAIDEIRAATLSLLDDGHRPTIGSVAEATGLTRRDLLARYMSAPSMIADATQSLVDSIEKRWAAFGPIDRDAPLDERLGELLDRRIQMEQWGRPIRQHTLDVDPSSRFDDEITTAFHAELSRLDPATRDDTGRLVGWLLRPRTIRAIISDVAVHPDVARNTIRSVAGGLLTVDR